MLVVVPGLVPLLMLGSLAAAGTDTHVPRGLDTVFLVIIAIGAVATIVAIVALAIGSRTGTLLATVVQAACAATLAVLWLVTGDLIFHELPWLALGLVFVLLADALAATAALTRSA
jgi:hypothetical protein